MCCTRIALVWLQPTLWGNTSIVASHGALKDIDQKEENSKALRIKNMQKQNVWIWSDACIFRQHIVMFIILASDSAQGKPKFPWLV